VILREKWAALVLAPLVSLGAAGCIPPRPSPSATIPPLAPTSAPTESAAASGSPGAGVTVDPTLLEVLPDAVDGRSLDPDAESAAAIAEDGTIAPFVSAIALASAFGPVATDVPPDYVVVTVAKLRPRVFGDGFFRGWRDTFDAAVCGQAGGVSGHAESQIGGRLTYIGTCAGGVHTYHVYLPARDAIVSAQSAGPGQFGEQVMSGITE
jgi:hypothetical protein